jgi:hypothetical protein
MTDGVGTDLPRPEPARVEETATSPPSRTAGGAPATATVKPTPLAWALAAVLVVLSFLFVWKFHWSRGFQPRVESIDALAGLTIAAMVVDRLLTFIPPWGAHETPAQRAADLRILRLGYGAVVGAAFVSVTSLRAISALTASKTSINSGLDRGVAVLAIAGGVAGLAHLLAALNPQQDTDASKDEAKDNDADGDELPPTWPARLLAVLAVAVAAAIALFAVHDKSGLELLQPSQTAADQAGGAVLLVVRFGTVMLAAAIVQQLIERLVVPMPWLKERNKPVVTGAVAVLLGVGAARLLDLFLLHNIGFFGAYGFKSIDVALHHSTGAARWFDTFVTGLAIAAGTKPLHDLASRLTKVAKKGKAAAAAANA